jgi:hypothetical protein
MESLSGCTGTRERTHDRTSTPATRITLRRLTSQARVIAGSLPRRALAVVAEWAALHQDELRANWNRARRDEPLQPIEPLP